LQTPAGDVPIRSVTLATDGSCLVAGNNKVSLRTLSSSRSHVHPRANVTYGRSTTKTPGSLDSRLSLPSMPTINILPVVFLVQTLGKKSSIQ
jgi:hypothetical protein